MSTSLAKSSLLQLDLRRSLRYALDSLFCKSYVDKQTLGHFEGAQWTLRTAALNSSSVVYSGGVGGDISFEIELVKLFGLSVVMFDPSPIAKETVAKYSRYPEMRRIEFVPVGLGAECKEQFFEPSNVPGEWLLGDGNHPESQSITCTTIAAEMKKRGHRKLALLKLDIEGFEYQVLNHCLDTNINVDQICVEFHHFLPHIPLKQTLGTILNLRKGDLRLIHKMRHDMTFCRV